MGTQKRYARVTANGLLVDQKSRKPVNRLLFKTWIVARELVPGLMIAGLFYAAFIHATN